MSAIQGNFYGGINAQAANAGPDSQIQYKYAVGDDGKLFVESAKVTSIVEKAVASAPVAKPSFGKSYIEPPRDLGLSPSDLADLFGLDSNEGIVQNRLEAADAGVRTHEAQHFRAAGGLAQGTAEYEYVEGPDGKLYAVAGEVSIASQTTGDPKDDAINAATLYNAATAPGDASAQDLAVARSAIQSANEAYGKALKASSELV